MVQGPGVQYLMFNIYVMIHLIDNIDINMPCTHCTWLQVHCWACMSIIDSLSMDDSPDSPANSASTRHPQLQALKNTSILALVHLSTHDGWLKLQSQIKTDCSGVKTRVLLLSCPARSWTDN